MMMMILRCACAIPFKTQTHAITHTHTLKHQNVVILNKLIFKRCYYYWLKFHLNFVKCCCCCDVMWFCKMSNFFVRFLLLLSLLYVGVNISWFRVFVSKICYFLFVEYVIFQLKCDSLQYDTLNSVKID